MEDVILMRLPADRFLHHIAPHYVPPLDKRSRYQVAMVIQSCKRNSFDTYEAGRTDEFHFWLRTASTDSVESESGHALILPSQHWLSLISASGNSMTRSYLQSFGFRPSILDEVKLQTNGGAVIFQNRGRIDWTINGHGRRFKRVGVDHILNVEADRPDTAGHRIYASISDPVMDQPGRIHIQTDSCEPFLHRGERFAAVVHRMSGLEANIDWIKKNNITFSH
ncbi:MAG: hypothetical protein ACWGNV_11545 [Bacteroidales bacterium]